MGQIEFMLIAFLAAIAAHAMVIMRFSESVPHEDLFSFYGAVVLAAGGYISVILDALTLPMKLMLSLHPAQIPLFDEATVFFFAATSIILLSALFVRARQEHCES